MTPGDRPLHVVQVSRYAQGGGAERVAASLHEGLRRRGQRSWMATARTSDDPSILTIPPPPTEPTSVVSRALLRAADRLGRPRKTGPVIRTLRRGLRFAAAPRKTLDKRRGRESFDYPGTAAIPDLPPEPPDLIHCHNLHGGFFDLRQLAPMSHRLPLVMTLHDEWTFTGHCAYTLVGERWRSGCVSCPDLAVYPAIPHDGTRANLRAKRRIYRRSRLYITTPSRWLMNRAQESAIAEGAADWRLIPNGIDRSIFKPGDAHAARARLELPPESFILLFAANGVRRSPFKDFATVSRAAVEAASRITSRPVLCLALGDTGPSESFPNGELRFVPYRSDVNDIAAYYQAADVYLHAAKAENLPITILEALATGLPVVATAVGGVPEEVQSLAGAPGGWSGAAHSRDEATGVLVAPGDGVGMGAAAAAMLRDDELRATLSGNAVADAARRFDFEQQLDSTISWYGEVIADWKARHRKA
jgi:glycosyltransferase involved in cell wall biosynthesis